MLKGITGLQNTGKTLAMTLYLLKDYVKGKKIYSNYSLSFPHKLVNKEEILSMSRDPDFNLYDSSIAIDEMWLFFDARRAMSDDNLALSWLMLQSSKSDTNIYGTAQRFGQFDKRFRDNLHLLVECERVLRTPNKIVRISASLETRDLSKIHPILNDLLRIEVKDYRRERAGLYEDFVLKRTRYIKAKPIFKLFDSFEKQHVAKK